MEKYTSTAQKLRLAKLDYELARSVADEKKKIYEQYRRDLCTQMVASEVRKFEILPSDDIPGLSFTLETKERWSPVVENKDRLMELLKTRAPELFTINANTLNSYLTDVVETFGEVPVEYRDLIKKYDDTHVTVRTKRR